MAGSRAFLAICLLAFVSCASGKSEQAIRHLVTADAIERGHVPESHVRIHAIRISGGEASVDVAVLGGEGEGRAVEWRAVHYVVKRVDDRWRVLSVK